MREAHELCWYLCWVTPLCLGMTLVELYIVNLCSVLNLQASQRN